MRLPPQRGVYDGRLGSTRANVDANAIAFPRGCTGRPRQLKADGGGCAHRGPAATPVPLRVSARRHPKAPSSPLNRAPPDDGAEGKAPCAEVSRTRVSLAQISGAGSVPLGVATGRARKRAPPVVWPVLEYGRAALSPSGQSGSLPHRPHRHRRSADGVAGVIESVAEEQPRPVGSSAAALRSAISAVEEASAT